MAMFKPDTQHVCLEGGDILPLAVTMLKLIMNLWKNYSR